MATTRSDILSGIEAELTDTPQYFDFKVVKTERDAEIWKVYVDLTNGNSNGLDESLEGSSAWWGGSPKGAADVLSVIPESEQINLRFATSPPPSEGKLIRIYPPRYLEALYKCWDNEVWSNRCLAWLEQMETANSFDEAQVPSKGPFKWLRRRQADAFSLLGWKASFLWGPPGTGKTTTLGAMLARYLIEYPASKVLLLSTTNSAVDQALVSLDKALEQLRESSAAVEVRKKCFRVGNHFIASHYKDREHLLPVQDTELIRRLAALEARKPDPSDVAAYAQWKQTVETIRAEIRKQAARVLDTARLAAMTTTRAVFTFDELYIRRPYDLIVFDEASQVGLAHAMALTPLANRCLFAGDPKQLAPIVQSSHPSAKHWLGRSMFEYMKESADSTCLLNEQSRMVEPICKIVSNVFYDGKLVIADDCKRNSKWENDREVFYVKPIGDNNVHLELFAKDGTWSHKYHGPIRYESADFICTLVCNLTAYMDESHIIVLTPFRAQRTLIRMFLRKAGKRKVTVSTVHRAQGSERHTVIFDPALGDSPFLQTEDARRLINVALSRAQARLVVILSPGDRKNPLFDQVANVIENVHRFRDAVPISQFASHPDFPHSAVGQVVQIKDIVGRIIESHGKSFELMDFSTGQKRKFITSYVKKSFG